VRVPAAGADRKFAVFGALDYASGKVHWQLSLRKDSQAFVIFLEQLRQTWPEEKLVIVLDNVGYHKSRQTLAWWQCWLHQVCPFFLPAYTPELNLMERVWRHVKEKLSCHRWWARLARTLAGHRGLIRALEGSLSPDLRSQHRSSPRFLFIHLDGSRIFSCRNICSLEFPSEQSLRLVFHW
jgi:transposase